jgi:hypothetical protein
MSSRSLSDIQNRAELSCLKSDPSDEFIDIDIDIGEVILKINIV